MTALATPTEIAAIRRRYLLMATSVLLIDIAFTLVFIVLTGAWSFAPRSLGGRLVLLRRRQLPSRASAVRADRTLPQG